jgi:hypothetical protein
MKSTAYSIVKIISFIIFILFVPGLFLYDNTPSIIWTVLIPLIPVVLLVIGFYNWREICPLAAVSKISQKLNWIPKRKVPDWFEKNFYSFQYGLLFVSLSLRLTTLNYDNRYLAYFFLLIIVSAFVVNFIYTGKSWCNFFCPVGAVEKIYTLSNAKNYNSNSACSTCTACKKNCPDIDLENNYWREGANEQKSFLFYSFSGLILGFYLYFYLQSGSFSYYFSGVWAHNELSPFADGFFFAKFVPVFIAAPLTLLICTLASYLLFKLLELYLLKYNIFNIPEKETVIHRVKVLSSFVAFNLFYIFAGAPAYMQYPLAYSLFYFIVVVSSTLIFYKEIFREESYFIQERFALKIIKRWNSNKPISNNLKEVYYSYIAENRNKEDRLKTYKKTVRDLMQEGILNENSIVILEKLRVQIGISEKEHFDIMKTIKLTNEELFDDSIEKSSERRYQRNSYRNMIEDALKKHAQLDDKYIKSLQQQFCITDETHKSIMNTILNNNEKLHDEVFDLLNKLHEYIHLQKSVYNDNSREVIFLKYVIKHEFTKISKDLFALLFIIYKDNKATLKILLDVAKEKQIDDSFDLSADTLAFMDSEITEKILLIKKEFDAQKSTHISDNKAVVCDLLHHRSPQIAAAALLVTNISPSEYLTDVNLEIFTKSEDEDIQKLAHKILYQTNDITIYERMMYLSTVELFKNIKFDDLHLLALSTKVIYYQKDEYIIKQGGVGDTLFVLIKGKAQVSINEKNSSILNDKDYFGEIAIMGDIKRTASVQALERTIALTISKKEFKLFLYENPKVSTKVMKGMIQKLTQSQS